jgi:anti-anti-sigma factor
MSEFVKIHEENQVWYIYLQKNMYFDLKDINSVWLEIYEQIPRVDQAKIVLNFEIVDTFSSLFIGKLVAFHKKIATSKGHLVLCNLKNRLLELFEVTKMNKVFILKETLHDANHYLKSL